MFCSSNNIINLSIKTLPSVNSVQEVDMRIRCNEKMRAYSRLIPLEIWNVVNLLLSHNTNID